MKHFYQDGRALFRDDSAPTHRAVSETCWIAARMFWRLMVAQHLTNSFYVVFFSFICRSFDNPISYDNPTGKIHARELSPDLRWVIVADQDCGILNFKVRNISAKLCSTADEGGIRPHHLKQPHTAFSFISNSSASKNSRSVYLRWIQSFCLLNKF